MGLKVAPGFVTNHHLQMAGQIVLELPPNHKIVTLEIVKLVIISLLLVYSFIQFVRNCFFQSEDIESLKKQGHQQITNI